MTIDHTGHGDPTTGGEPMPCGRSGDALLGQVADGRGGERDDHQAGCVHCQAGLAEYERLWSPLRELAAEKVVPADNLLDAALVRIRGALDDTGYATLRSADGVTRVAARVVVVAARRTAEDVPGVRVALGRHLEDRHGGGSDVVAGVAGASTAIEITLAADYGTPLLELADRVRRSVAARVRYLTDLEPVEITVIVDDVFD